MSALYWSTFSTVPLTSRGFVVSVAVFVSVVEVSVEVFSSVGLASAACVVVSASVGFASSCEAASSGAGLLASASFSAFSMAFNTSSGNLSRAGASLMVPFPSVGVSASVASAIGDAKKVAPIITEATPTENLRILYLHLLSKNLLPIRFSTSFRFILVSVCNKTEKQSLTLLFTAFYAP